MALSDYKITQEETAANGVVSAPDVLTGTAQENKAVFDKLINQTVMVKHNGLIDELSTSGAGDTGITDIPGLVAETVQEALEEINANVGEIIDPNNPETAGKIGITQFEGVAASTVQGALETIQGNLNTETAILDNKIDALSASDIANDPISGLSAENVQDALEEIKSDADAIVTPSNSGTAGRIGSMAFTGVQATNVQDALEEIQQNLDAAVSSIQQDVPQAEEVPVTPFPGVTSDNVQDALEELNEKVEDIQSGVIPPGSITSDMIQDGAITPDKLASGAGGGSVLTITFANGFQGASYTLTGGGQTFTGTVGNSLKAVYGLLATNTEYTLDLTQGGNEYEFTITTLGYYKDLELSAAVVVSAVPTQSGTLTYTGAAQSPTWTGYDPNKLSMTGDTSKVNAGNYTTTFTPKPGCVWWDGTAESKNASWSISKAAIAIPTAEDTELDYTGTSQHPEWENYDPDKITIGGDTAATDEGEYQTTFAPKENYQWTDETTETKTISWSIKAGQISVPTVSGTLTYNGTSQSPVWSGYDTTKMTIGGQTAGVNAGAYTATFTPKTNYEWTDGTTAAKEVVWNIGKAVPVLTVSPTSVEVSTSTPTATAAISYNGDGTLSATSNGIASGSVSGNTLTVTGLATGDTTVTVNASEGTNYQAASASVSVSSSVATGFADASWEQIAADIQDGSYTTKYEVGETKDITLTGIGTMTLQIADFDHDYLSGNTSANKAAITLITKDLLPDTKQMNATNTNVGGFPASDLYDYLNDTIYAALPEDLKSLVVPIYKWYGTGNNTTNGAWHGCKVWIPLEYEMFGTTTYSPATEHTTGNARKYPIFTNNASRVKKLNNGSGSANWYWEASPYASYAAGFCAVGSNGSAGIHGASDAYGVCFGLCIGAPNSFATDSWETIAQHGTNGTASSVYNIGDTKDITISGVGTMTLQIADFNHDYVEGSTSAKTAGITLITKDLLPETKQMNSSDTNVGGFPASSLYDYLNDTIFPNLPEDLKSVVVPIYKWYGTGNNTTNGAWHGCKVWIPLEYEMFGDETYAPTTERTTGNARKYPVFTDNASRIKRLNNGSGSTQRYWEASPDASDTTAFCCVYSSGNANSSTAHFSGGVCFGLCIGAPRSFATDTWEQIAAASADGTASEIYSLGDTKDITLSGIGTMTLEIADFDHDYLSASTSAQKAGISLITKDLLPDTKQMNSTSTNVGGFPDSALYDYLSTTVWNALPAELRNVVKTCYKWYGTGNNTTNGAWHGSKLWVPLEYEMFGSNTYSPATEHSTGNARKYPIFTDNASRVKRMNNGNGGAQWYWEASPYASDTTRFCYVDSGNANYTGASDAGGVCFGLCV